MNIARDDYIQLALRLLEQFPVVLLLGPRQCGKTTLARQIADSRDAAFFDLEDPDCALRPETAAFTLKPLHGLVVIDEFQRSPKLFELLRVLADRRPLPARFLILGSASLDLVKGVSESLAGRVAYMPMGGFRLDEVGADLWQRLWTRGRFPNSYLAATDAASFAWRQNFVQSFLERDLPQLGLSIPAAGLRRFWIMLAHWHGQRWNASDLARSMDTSPKTAKRYLDVLTGAYMVRQLQPWFANSAKRLVKAPKVYLRDTGLLHTLLGLRSFDDLMAHPRLGFSWEGFAIEEILSRFHAERDAFYYRTHGGTELDLLIVRGGKKIGFEFKFTSTPKLSRAMRESIAELNLNRLFIVCPAAERYSIHDNVEITPIHRITGEDVSVD